MTSIVKASRTEATTNFGNDWREAEDAVLVKDKLKYILTNEHTQQDVIIVAGSTETKIKAHSVLLFMGSQVLENLLQQAKINNDGMKEIKLPDVRPDAMKFVLEFIYTDCTELECEDAIEILYASLKLNLRGLAAKCVAKLRDEISAANVLRIFEESTKMNVEELTQKSQQFILKNAGEIFQTEQFLNITNESLCKLLASDELEMDEISIFNSTISWAKAECVRSELEETSENLRFVLKRVVPLIRFTLIPLHEFARIVVSSNLLDHQEVIDVYTYVGMKSSNSNEQAELPLWISSSSERRINQTETVQLEQIQSKNTKKAKLLQFIKDISGKKTFSGLWVSSSIDNVNKGFQSIHRITSLHPAILTVRMPSYLDGVDLWKSFTKEIISHWNNGYMVHLVWFEGQHPLAISGILKTPDDNEWNDLLTYDGHLNREWKKQLDNVVPYLQQLQDAGVIIICNICFLLNYKSFSYGGRPGMNGSVKLYQITHDYMTKTHNLHSLLWPWSLYIDGDTTKLEEYWPGNEYVDVVSIHMGTKKQVEMILYQKLLEVVGDKPISMECMCTVPSTEDLSLQPRWTWFTALDSHLEKASSYYNDARIRTTFQSLSIINKENNEFFKTLNQ